MKQCTYRESAAVLGREVIFDQAPPSWTYSIFISIGLERRTVTLMVSPNS